MDVGHGDKLRDVPPDGLLSVCPLTRDIQAQRQKRRAQDGGPFPTILSYLP